MHYVMKRASMFAQYHTSGHNTSNLLTNYQPNMLLRQSPSYSQRRTSVLITQLKNIFFPIEE